MTSKLLTREMLQEHGITNITEDGRIFIGDKEVKQTVAAKKGKYKVQQPYAKVQFSDKSQKRYYINKNGYEYWTYPAVSILVNRAVYAWYYGEVPAGYEVDHIDNNTTNNHLSNLRLLTKEENLARKPVSKNQYTYWKTDEEILAERANKKYVYDRSQHKAVQTDWWINEKAERKIKKIKDKSKDDATKALWHTLNKEIREKKAERRQIDKATNMNKWRELGRELELLQIAVIETRKKLRK